MWEIIFYWTADGECLPKEYLHSLHPKTERPYVDENIKRLETFGNQLRRPYTAPLGDGLFELRTRVVNKQLRLIFFFQPGYKIIITHGFSKRDDKVDPEEIKRAIDYRFDYLQRFPEEKPKKARKK